jgi:metal-dependent amidase/aminoacylase/carboxypeptidase family protein
MNARLLDPGLLEQAKRIRDDLVAIRRAIHAQPEFGFEEHETAALIAERLTALGAQVRTGVAERASSLNLAADSPSSPYAPTWTRCRLPRPPARRSPRGFQA